MANVFKKNGQNHKLSQYNQHAVALKFQRKRKKAVAIYVFPEYAKVIR